MSPKQIAVLVRFLKITALGCAVLFVDGFITLTTNNAFDIAPTYQAFVMLLAVPALAAAEKWLTWEETQITLVARSR